MSRRYLSEDLLAPDAVVCPDCADFAHPSQTVCDGCGTHLYVRAKRKETTVEAKPHCTCGGRGLCVHCTLSGYDDTPVREEPDDEYLTRRGPYVFDNRDENDRSL